MLTVVHVFASCSSQTRPCDQRFLSNMAFSINFMKLFASLISCIAGLFTPQEKPLHEQSVVSIVHCAYARSLICCYRYNDINFIHLKEIQCC